MHPLVELLVWLTALWLVAVLAWVACLLATVWIEVRRIDRILAGKHVPPKPEPSGWTMDVHCGGTGRLHGEQSCYGRPTVKISRPCGGCKECDYGRAVRPNGEE